VRAVPSDVADLAAAIEVRAVPRPAAVIGDLVTAPIAAAEPDCASLRR